MNALLKTILRLAAGPALCTLIASAPALAQGNEPGKDSTFAIAPSNSITIVDTDHREYNSRFDVRVVGWNKPQIVVQKHVLRGDPSDVQFLVDQRGKSASISMSIGLPSNIDDVLSKHRAPGAGPVMSVLAYVPSGADLTVSNINGSITIERVQGRITVDSANADISLLDVGDHVKATAANGSIRMVLARSGKVSGITLLSQANGSVDLVVPKEFSQPIEAAAPNGSVAYGGVARAAHAAVMLEAGNGNVSIRRNP